MRTLVFTGAGISRESGLKTFRDAGGLWEGYRVEEVCSTTAWRTNPELVLDFYNMRRRETLAAEPNVAHRAIADLEAAGHAVTVVTQNIDDLHERAGSQRVIHLHGQIRKSRSEADWRLEKLYDCSGDICLGDRAEDGCQLRPHVVFFGEGVCHIEEAMAASLNADILLVVGTTLQVTPAAYVATETGAQDVWIVDPVQPAWRRGDGRLVRRIGKPATEGVIEAVREIQAVCDGKTPVL